MPRATSLASLLAAIAATALSAMADPPDLNTIDVTDATHLDVELQLDTAGADLDLIRAWYTSDRSRTWHPIDLGPAPASALRFTPPAEGLFGLYFVVETRGGPSGPEPTAPTEPHHWLFVDRTPPVVQLNSVEPADPPTTPQTVRIRWSAIDDLMPATPVTLAYRTIPDGDWTDIADPLPNAGVHDWQITCNEGQQAVVRLTVADRAGHRTTATSDPFTLRRKTIPTPAAEPVTDPHVAGAQALTGRVATQAIRDDGNLDDHARADRLYRLGRNHSIRGEYRLADARLREALALDAARTDALVELGTVLYAQGHAPDAVEAFKLALQQQPGLRSALEGLALTYIAERKFPDAVGQLSRIVRIDPNDAEAWLNLGDVAIYQGDELLAREHYTKAATRNPNADDVVRRARLRLAELTQLADKFKQIE